MRLTPRLNETKETACQKEKKNGHIYLKLHF